MIRRLSLLICLFLLFTPAISGCRTALTPSPSPTQALTAQTPTSTPDPTASETPVPLPTFTQTLLPQPTSTPTQTATPTLTPLDRSIALTPLPQFTQAITANNIQNLQLMAVWGTGRARELSVSRDGLFLTVGTSIGAYMYDITTYEELAVLPTPAPVDSIAFSIDNQFIALGQANQAIDIFNKNSFEHIIRLEITEWDLEDDFDITIYFSPLDNNLVSMINTPETIYINRWDSFNWSLLDAYSVRKGAASYAIPAINLIGILREDALILQSINYPDDLDTVQLPSDLTPGFLEQLRLNNGEIISSSTGDFILMNNGEALTHWTISDSETSYRFDNYPFVEPASCYDVPPSCINQSGTYSWDCPPSPLINPIVKVILTPDNIMMLILLNSGRTEFRRASDGLIVWDLDIQFTNITFSPGGDLFFGLRPDGTIEKRSTLDGGLIDSLNLHPSRLFDLAYSPDGTILAASFSDGWIRVFSTVNGQMLGVLDGNASALTFSPGSNWLAAGLNDGALRIFELAEGRYFDFVAKHHAAITDIAFSGDGTQLVSSSEDCTIGLWDPINRYRVRLLSPNWLDPFQVTGIKFFPGNTIQFISGNRDVIASVRGTQVDEVLLDSQFGFNDLAISQSGRWLAASGSKSWLLSLTDEGTINRSLLLEDIEGEGTALGFSLDGSTLIIASKEDLHFWSVDPLNFYGKLSTDRVTDQKNLIVTLSVSPDGSMLALASLDGQILIFAIP